MPSIPKTVHLFGDNTLSQSPAVKATFEQGLAMLAKSNSLFIIPAIGVAIILACGWKNWRDWVPRGALTAGAGGC